MRYLESIGVDISPSFRASKDLSESYLHLRHTLELNDVLIAALRLKHSHADYYLARYIQERTLKHSPYKANGITLIPAGFVDIRQRTAERSLCLILEHDRGTEQQEHFRRRIRAYKTFLTSGGMTQLFNINRAAVAFTTFVSSKRVAQMPNLLLSRN
jgi:Replication-relaxation